MTTSFTVCGDHVSGDLLANVARQAGCHLWQPEGAEPLQVLGRADSGDPLVVLVADVDEDRLGAALRRPVVACIEAAGGQVPDLSAIKLDGLYLDLSTMTAYGLEPAHQFCDALAERIELSEQTRSMMELALHEALVNAMVHGNLEIGPIAKESLDDFIQFCQLIETRLADPQFGARRVVIYATWAGETVDVAIEDMGQGYDVSVMDEPIDVGKKCGRGLFLIRDIARDVSIEDGGRRMVMRFGR